MQAAHLGGDADARQGRGQVGIGRLVAQGHGAGGAAFAGEDVGGVIVVAVLAGGLEHRLVALQGGVRPVDLDLQIGVGHRGLGQGQFRAVGVLLPHLAEEQAGAQHRGRARRRLGGGRLGRRGLRQGRPANEDEGQASHGQTTMFQEPTPCLILLWAGAGPAGPSLSAKRGPPQAGASPGLPRT